MTPLAGDRVPLRPVVAGGDDRRERLALGAAVAVLLEQAPGDVAFAAADEALADDDRQREVDDRRGGADGLDLGRLLDDAQTAHALPHVLEAAAVGAAQRPIVGVREGAGLVAQGAAGAEALRRRGRRVGEQVRRRPVSTSSNAATSSCTCSK